MSGLASVLVVVSLTYAVTLFVMSRRRRRADLPAPDKLFFVFVVPCLNEELVIDKSLDRLAAIPGDNFAVLVIDDGSDDVTADIVRARASDRLWLFERKAPNARQGKGEALNAAYRYLRNSSLLAGRDHNDVVLAVLDADGRIAPNALYAVAPYFSDPLTGAVQIGVRMYNAHEGWLARMQDIEFVSYTEIFQRARQRLGSVGLGGNGQFARLGALESLGPAPWTDCLTEDLDLGIQLLAGGWRNHFCPTTYVSQQAVTSVKRLVRQRTRWFQGHLQCWSRIPMIVTSRLEASTAVDLVVHLVVASLVLLMTVPIAAFLLALVVTTAVSPSTAFDGVLGGDAVVALLYLMTFGLSLLYGYAYWLRDPASSLPGALLRAHSFTLYSYLWFPAGWMAVWRMVRGKRGWAKTARTRDAGAPVAA
jgi:1,2-diacylglycerol 3-beta-glucosyltransferase